MASTIFGVHLSSCLCFVWLLTVVSSAQTNYDEQYARLMFMLAAGAYSPQPETCINETSRLSAQPFQLYSQSNTNCDTNGNSCAFFVTFSPTLRQIVIIYRGTKSKKQLIQEFLQSLQPNVDFYGHGKVNRYFFRALNALWDSSTAILSDPTFRDYTVTFVGHSLGGALASLAAMRTVLERLRSSQQVRMYSFGQPRVGTYKFSVEHDLLVPESYRVVNRNDVVPHLPLCHVRPEVQRNDNDETTNEKDVDPDPDSESFNLAEAIKNPCDGTEAKKAYHHGTEIWYPQGMFDGAPYRECLGLPKNEDHSCSNSQKLEPSLFAVNRQIQDHVNYFNQRVSKFGKNGCRALVEEKIEEPIITAGFGAAKPNDSTERPNGFKLAALGFFEKLNHLRNVFNVKSNVFVFVMFFGILAFAFASPMIKNDNVTMPGEFLLRRGPMIRSEVFDPATNITHIWDMRNGTSQVHGNTITRKHDSSSSSESKENEKSS